MRGQGQLIAGVVVGAGAMYLLDPDGGARRRASLRQKGVEAGHQLSDRFPALGELASPREGAALGQERWSPRVRLTLGGVGGLMALKGLRTRGVGGEVLTALGAALLTRAVSNTPPQHLVDLVSGGSSAIRPTGLEEVERPVEPAPAPEEVAAHASSHRRTTKSTKRRRSRE